MNHKLTVLGQQISISGEPPKVGMIAPDFTIVKKDFSEVSLYKLPNVTKLLMIMPSVDTIVCIKQIRSFHLELTLQKELIVIGMSMDLPLALDRFCASESIHNFIFGSDVRHKHIAERYGLEMLGGPFQGMLARATFVLNKSNEVTFAEIKTEVTKEPNYAHIIKAVKAVSK